MIAYVDEFGRIDELPDPADRQEIELEDIQISVPKDEDMPPEDKTRRQGDHVQSRQGIRLHPRPRQW